MASLSPPHSKNSGSSSGSGKGDNKYKRLPSHFKTSDSSENNNSTPSLAFLEPVASQSGSSPEKRHSHPEYVLPPHPAIEQKTRSRASRRSSSPNKCVACMGDLAFKRSEKEYQRMHIKHRQDIERALQNPLPELERKTGVSVKTADVSPGLDLATSAALPSTEDTVPLLNDEGHKTSSPEEATSPTNSYSGKTKERGEKREAGASIDVTGEQPRKRLVVRHVKPTAVSQTNVPKGDKQDSDSQPDIASGETRMSKKHVTIDESQNQEFSPATKKTVESKPNESKYHWRFPHHPSSIEDGINQLSSTTGIPVPYTPRVEEPKDSHPINFFEPARSDHPNTIDEADEKTKSREKFVAFAGTYKTASQEATFDGGPNPKSTDRRSRYASEIDLERVLDESERQPRYHADEWHQWCKLNGMKFQTVVQGPGLERSGDFGFGGHALIYPGDIIDGQTLLPGMQGQYEVHRKLAHDEYATIWLVRNQTNNVFRTMKVFRAELNAHCWADVDNNGRPRISTLWELNCDEADDLGCRFVNHLLHAFEFYDQNGIHKCLIYEEPMGGSLGDLKSRFRDGKLPVDVEQRISRQVLSAMDFIHGRDVVVTNFDAKNVFVKIPDLRFIPWYLERTEKQMPPFKAMAQKEREDEIEEFRSYNPELVQICNLGEHVVYPFPYLFEIRLCNLELAHRGSEHKLNPLLTILDNCQLYSPELRMGVPVAVASYEDDEAPDNAPWVYSSTDIFNLADFFFELHTGLHLTLGGGEHRSYHDRMNVAKGWLAELMAYLGPMPEHMVYDMYAPLAHELDDNMQYFTTVKRYAWSPLYDYPDNLPYGPMDWANKWHPTDFTDRSSMYLFMHFIAKMFTWDPEQRWTAQQLLDHPWMQGVDFKAEDRRTKLLAQNLSNWQFCAARTAWYHFNVAGEENLKYFPQTWQDLKNVFELEPYLQEAARVKKLSQPAPVSMIFNHARQKKKVVRSESSGNQKCRDLDFSGNPKWHPLTDEYYNVAKFPSVYESGVARVAGVDTDEDTYEAQGGKKAKVRELEMVGNFEIYPMSEVIWQEIQLTGESLSRWWRSRGSLWQKIQRARERVLNSLRSSESEPDPFES